MEAPTADEPPEGAGNPRLVMTTGGHALAGTPEAEGERAAFRITGDVTTIGSSEDSDVHLPRVEPAHGEIRREADEYVYHQVSPLGEARVDGVLASTAALHHGDRLTVGESTMIFQRDEHADHVRPQGGRQGGESSGNPRTGSRGHESEVGG